MRYFACISYDGFSFFGWQKQEVSSNTVQYHIESTLTMLLRENIVTMGCGRTDTGVHAKKFYLHFDCSKEIDVLDIIYHANKIIPNSIVIHSIFKVADDAHARFDATERSYVYRIKLERDPFDKFNFYYSYKVTNLFLDELNQLAQIVLKGNDFTSFAKTRASAKTNICSVTECKWSYDEHANCYEFRITANRFLRGMIRLLVGAMLNVQRGKISKEEFTLAVMEQKPLPTSWSIDADGLILYGVKYPYILF